MDLLNKFTKGDAQQQPGQQAHQQTTTTENSGSSSSGGLMGKLNSVAGGGKDSEKHEDGLDKAVDWVQENVLKQGAQNNESAAEQLKDEQISDAIRAQYKSATGKDFPIQDKDRKYGL